MQQSLYKKVASSNKIPFVSSKKLEGPLATYFNRGVLVEIKKGFFGIDANYLINRETLEISVPKIITLVRGLADLNEKVELGFFNFYSAMECLSEQGYRSKQEGFQVISRLKDLCLKHFEGYCRVTGRSSSLTFKAVKSKNFPGARLYQNRGMGKPKIYLDETNGTYYLHENLFKDLLSYGYTEKQLKEVISNFMESKQATLGIPAFLLKKHFKIPDLANEFEKHLEKI